MKEGLAIIIPAAGESRRMGQAKQLLTWKGKTLLAHSIEKAKSISPQYLYVISGARKEQIESEVKSIGASTVHSSHWQEGIGVSIAQGVTQILDIHSDVSAFLILLPDQPFVTATHLERLIYHSTSHKLVATSYNSKPGVPALISNEFFPDLRALRGDSGARSIFVSNPEQLITINPDFDLMDIDTLEDFRQL